MSAYFHCQGKECLHHHPLQLPVVITSLLFSTPHINMINLIASHPNNPSFSVLVFPHLPTSCHYRVACFKPPDPDHLITWSVGNEVYRASLHLPFTLAFQHLASAYLGPANVLNFSVDSCWMASTFRFNPWSEMFLDSGFNWRERPFSYFN